MSDDRAFRAGAGIFDALLDDADVSIAPQHFQLPRKHVGACGEYGFYAPRGLPGHVTCERCKAYLARKGKR